MKERGVAVHNVTMEHVSNREQDLKRVSEGVHLADLATGERTDMKRWRVEPGATLPIHSHHNEQIGYVISGQLTAIVDGEEYELEPGDSYVFPSEELHGAENRADEPAIGIGVLTPPRNEPRWGDATTKADTPESDSDASASESDD